MNFLQGLWSLFIALPEIVKLVNRFVTAYDKAKRDGIIQGFEVAADATEKATTPEQRFEAAAAWSRAIRGIGSSR